jgi:hypothetical protein
MIGAKGVSEGDRLAAETLDERRPKFRTARGRLYIRRKLELAEEMETIWW